MLDQKQNSETNCNQTQTAIATENVQTELHESNQNAKGIFLAKVIVDKTSNGTENVEEGESNNKSNIPHLYVEANDVVAIENEIDDYYYLAKSDHQTGRLAKRACLILDEQIPNVLCQYLLDNQFFDLHICFASFVAQDFGDLSITKGDIIVAINPVNEHWLQGQVCFDSQANCWPTLVLGRQVGTFPLNHCWRLNQAQVKLFCTNKLKRESQIKYTIQNTPWSFNGSSKPSKILLQPATQSASLSSGSSSIYSSDNTNHNDLNSNATVVDNLQHLNLNNNRQPQLNHDKDSDTAKPPPRPELPKQLSNYQKSSSEQVVSKQSGIISNKQKDKLNGWLHTVRKKTARCAMRISANLGLISLTRDEVFEQHYDNFKKLEKSIRVFIKNLTLFVDHFESFLLALQSTSDNLADFYRDKTHQKEIIELRKKNKALNCEHFHAFKRTVDRQVISVVSQLLHKFSGPHHLAQKRSAKLLDYDTKTKEMESCKDSEKKMVLQEQYFIARDLYERINSQLIEELPIFNQFALDIFRECILVLLESRRNLIMSYTKQTEILLKTPLLSSFTASDVASAIMMTCDFAVNQAEPDLPGPQASSTFDVKSPASSKSTRSGMNFSLNRDYKGSGTESEHGTQPSSSGPIGDFAALSRPQSALSQLSSDFEQMGVMNREICSTPLPQSYDLQQMRQNQVSHEVQHDNPINQFDEPDAEVEFVELEHATSDNKLNENIESAMAATATAAIASEVNDLDSAAKLQNGDSELASKDKRKKKRSKRSIYIASWPFVSTGPNQLTIACNQPLKLLKGCDSVGNPDWSLVKNQLNEIGYVPTSYLKKRESN